MAGNWWDADKIDGPESAGNWWDADAVVKDDAPSAATAGPDAKGDGFFSLDRAKGVLSILANAVPFVGADDGKPNPFAEYVKGAAERARGNLPVLEDGTLKPAEPKKFKSVLETQAWPDTVPSDDELRHLSRRDYAKAQEDEARRIRTGGHEMRATKPAPILSAAEAGAKRFAEDNPVTASIKSSAAQSLAGLANAPSAAAQAGNEMVRNAMIGFGADVPASRVPNMPLVDDLMKMSGAYTSELQRRAPGEAWDRGEFGQWLLTQLGGNSMNTIQSLGALMVPGMQGALLTSMGATAAGTSYATGDSGIASIGKGVVEAASEKLPLEAAGFATKKVSSLIEKIPAASRNAILQDAGRRLVAAGGAVTFNSLVGAIEESAAQIGGNAIDIAIDGKTKSLFDEVDRAAIVGAAANTSMAAPAIIEAARRPTTDAGRLAGELADALNGGQFAQAGIDQTVSDMLRTVGTSDNIAPTSTSMAAAAGERARLEQMRAPRPTVADIGKAASVDEAIATAAQAVAPDVPPSVQPAQAAQVPAGTGRAVQLDEADLLKRAMAGIGIPQDAAPLAPAQAAPVVAPEAATPAAQDQPVRTWFGRRGDGYATPEDAQRGLSERQRLQKDLQWRIEQTPEGRYRLAGYAVPVGGTQALQTPSPKAEPAMPKPLPAARSASQGQDIILQNRDRNTPASIDQMQSIAANPDYLRAGPSRTLDQGAPVAFGAMPPSAVQGRAETVADGRGQRIQIQYAVVEAADLLASNQADGTPLPEYATGEAGRLRVVAGNGRTAGLQAAYLRGTAAQYREELQQDAQSLGIDPQAVAAMREPVLIRVMDEADVTPDIADRSNIQAGAEMSAVERANNDARRIHVSDMEFHDNGTPTEASLLRFIQSMPVSERGGLVDDKGPTQQAIDRVMAVAFKQAYGGDELVRLFAQATDPESRVVIGALARIAGRMAQLDGAGAFDIRGAVADAAGMAITAKRRGKKLADIVLQGDLDLSPEAVVVARFMADNIRSGQRIADGLLAWVDLALDQVRIVEQNASSTGMFGEEPTLSRQQLFERLGKNGNTATAIEEPAAQRGGAVAAGEGAERREAEPAGDGRGAEDGAGGRGAETEGSGQQVERAPSVGQDLLGDKPNTSQQQAADERARRASQDQQRRNAAPAPEEFALGMEDARTGREVDPRQQDMELLRQVDEAVQDADADTLPGFSRSASTKAAYEARIDAQRSSAPQPSTTGATVATITDAIRQAYGPVLPQLQANGLVTLVQSQDEAIEAAAKARADKTGESLETVRERLMASVRNSIAVWHGSPHRWIEKTGFKLNKIGSGEGAQAYGWGMYFASLRGVAEHYQKALEYNDDDTQDLAESFIDRADGSERQAARDLRHAAANESSAELKQRHLDAADWIDAGKKKKNPSQLYSLNLPVEESDLLDWDRPLSEQSQNVRDAMIPVARMLYPRKDIYSDDDLLSRTGEFIYKGLSGYRNGGPKAASSRLQAAGIPGLRYLDGNSRSNGNGSHNYVIWDEALMTPEAAGIEAKFSKNGAIQGFYDPQSGQSFLIADGLTEAAAPGVLAHEVGIHMAADTSSDNGKAAFDKITARAGQLLELGRGNVFFDRVNQRMRDAGETSNEEAAAYIAEEYERDRVNAPASVKRWITDFMAAVRAWLFGKGVMVKASDLGAADIAAIARANVRAAAKGSVSNGGLDGQLRRSDASPTENEVRALVQQYARTDGAPTEAQIREAVRQFRETDRAYGGRDGYQKTKAAGKTKLTYGQWVQVRTPNFKNWFGDWESDPAHASKVVDRDTGEPLVVYHGAAKDIAQFDVSRSGQSTGNTGFYGAGAYFTQDTASAAGYAGWAQRTEEDAPNLIPAYLSIQSPVYVHLNPKTEAHRARSRETVGALVGTLESEGFFGPAASANEAGSELARLRSFIEKADFERSMGTLYRLLNGGQGVADLAQRAGFDGVLVYATKDGRESLEEAVAFRPEQIKSATGNSGAFDPADPDIRRSSNGSIQGFFDPQSGQSFMIADGLTNEAAPGVLVHEVGIHMAADTSSDKGKAAFDKIVERAGQLLELGRGNVFFDRVNQRMRDAGETSNEEVAAYIAEEYERDRVNAPASVKRWVTDFLAAVRGWLFGKGVLVKASDLGAADIAAIARANVRKAARGDGMLSGDGSVRRSDASPTEDEVRGLMQQYADVAGAPTEAQMRAAVQDYRETERAYGGKPAYDKARAAGKTKLNYGQWVQTRTQHFKNWFGDWQALAAQERLDAMEPIKVRVPDAWQNLPVNELRQRVEESLLQLMESGEPLHHPEVGEVSVVRKGIKKALASSADPAKLRVLGDLRHAFEWSFLAGTQAAQGEEHNVLAYDKLLARLDVGGSEVVAVFTVKRLTDGSQFYNTVALDDGQNKTPVASPRDTPIAGEHATSANTGVSDFVRRPLARVKPDSVSKVVDPQTGEPAVVFHGTHGDFSEFNAQDRVSTDSGMLGSGHYFTPDPKRAGDWYATRRDRETGAALAGGNVMPVFLNARKPLEIRLQAGQDLQAVLVGMSRDMGLERMPSMSNDEANAKWAPLFTQALRERGHDGVRLVLSNGVTQEVSVFDGASAKSATGNIGTFDGEKGDIRFSYATKATQGNNTYTLPDERFGGLRRKMQDYFIRALEVQNAVAQQGGAVDEQTDFYRAEELSSGRRAALVQDFGNNVVNPLMKRAAQLGVDLSELSLYAYAKHAQERNEYIATINERLPDGGSGMTTADADAILDKVRQEGREQDFEELHQGLMDITASTRALQLSEGLITQDEFDAMQAQYQNYIPLRGFEQVDEDGKTTGRSPGKGFNIRGQENLRALGRSSRAGELIENAIHDYIRTVDRGERNQVGKVFLNFVLQNQDASLWEVDAERTRAAMDRQTGRVKGVTSIDKGEDTIAVKVAGREVYVRIHDPLLLRAMRKSHTDDRGDNERLVVRALGLYTSLLRNTLTRWNPEFALVNALRDYGFGAMAMVDVLGEKGAAKFTKHYAGAMAASHRKELNKADPQNREWDKYFTEFRLAGGMTAGFYVKNTEEIGKDIRSMMLMAGAQPKNKTEALFASSPGRAIAAAGRMLAYAGSVSENAARVAAYRTAREMGKSPSEAASIAKNLTTNFDRKGELGQVINAAYVFYNAAVQGSHRLLKMLANPKVAVYMAGFGVAGLALALANADWGGDDPDDGMAYWDKIPAYEKERNLIIMLPPGAQMAGEERVGTQGRYIKIPLQYGLNLPVAYGYAIADVIRNQRDKSRGMSPAKAGVTMASYLAGAFNPFGGSVDLGDKHSVMLAALPSVFDFAYQHALGVNGFGRDVAPFKSPFDTKPDSENYNLRQADSVSLGIARMLNRATGGSAAEAGGIDISAGTVENLIRNVSGGTGAFIYDVGNLAWKSVDRATGGDPDIFVREMPLYRRVYGELGGDVDQGIFYENRKKTQEAAGIVKRSGELDMEPGEEHQPLAHMDKFANKATRDLAKLRREMIRVKQDDSLSNAEKTKELRELRAARDQITAGFNQAFTEVMREFFAEQK